MSKDWSARDAPKYKKALRLNSQSLTGSFSISHAPAMLIPLMIGLLLLRFGMPRLPAVLITFWIFSTFLFAIRDKPERFLRRLRASRRKHWKRKLARSKSLFK